VVFFSFRSSPGLQHWISTHPHLAGQAPSTFRVSSFSPWFVSVGFLGWWFYCISVRADVCQRKFCLLLSFKAW